LFIQTNNLNSVDSFPMILLLLMILLN